MQGLAEEEAAKALILVDAARCPNRLIASKIGNIVTWFYDHLARLLYAEATSWKPTDVADLREYVDHSRKAHFLEGAPPVYILPNLLLYTRESLLYADIQSEEDGKLSWSNPADCIPPFSKANTEAMPPSSLLLAEAMSAFGIFTPRGLMVTSEIWDEMEFVDSERPEDALKLTTALVGRLVEEGLPREEVTNQHFRTLRDFWQMPMYNLDFNLLDVSMEELEAEREPELMWLASW